MNDTAVVGLTGGRPQTPEMVADPMIVKLSEGQIKLLQARQAEVTAANNNLGLVVTTILADYLPCAVEDNGIDLEAGEIRLQDKPEEESGG